MKTPNLEIKKALKTIQKLDHGKRIEFVSLYGSTAERRQSNLSDIDIAVYYKGDKKERFRFRLKSLGRLENKFDVQIFQDIPLYIKKDIISKGKVLYYKKYETLFDIYLKTVREYEDFKKYLNLYYSCLET